MKLDTHIVDKPWGRPNIPEIFGDVADARVGELWYDGPQKLPLLVKWLFTSQKLSVQVHPSDSHAKSRGMPSGKEECWYIVDAEPDAVLGMGTVNALSKEELRAASISGEIEQLLSWKPVKAGDYFYIPAGTIHAIGAGITLVEIQQNADITYRLYDYKRLDNGKLRQLHLDDGIAVANATPYEDALCGHADGNQQIITTDYFKLWLAINDEGVSDIPVGQQRWVTPIAGEAIVNGAWAGVGECILAQSGDKIQIKPDSKILIATQ